MHFMLARFLLLFYWGAYCHGQINVTIEDTDTRILYLPPNRWRVSSIPCAVCLNPTIAGNVTWHDGTSLTNRSSEYYHARWSAVGGTDELSTASFSTKANNREAPVGDVPMTAQLNFSGSAIYLYAIIPHTIPFMGSIPTITNLTFILDGKTAGQYVHVPLAKPNSTAPDFLTDVNIFASNNLSHPNQHALEINVGPNSALLLDHIIFTEVNGDQPKNNDRRSKKVATFAGAVAGSFGVFLLLATGLGVNLILRRNRARRRELEERANQSGNPGEFVPRYFPGTLPPPYSEASPPVMSDISSHRPATLTSISSPSRSLNEVDSGGLEPGDELPIPHVPPPSFLEATASVPHIQAIETEETREAGNVDPPGLSPVNRTEGHERTP